VSLAFLSPDPTDCVLGVVELRGELDGFETRDGERLVLLTPARTLLLADAPVADAVARARAVGLRAYDVSGGWVAIGVEGEHLLRRLTDLDPAALPAAGPVARDVPAVILPAGGKRWQVLVPRELSQSVASVVAEAG
jgi:sarcosine oxidase gamma subunit